MPIHGNIEQSSQEVAARRAGGEQFILLDVREEYERRWADLNSGVYYAPLSELATHGVSALPTAAQDKQAEIVVFCHLGQRSLQVVWWLRQQGWENVWNMTGGIDAWARTIDASVGRY